jgi:DNA-binding NtrC family response regulator
MTAKVKILVVDDDPYLLDMLIETLKTIGYDASGAPGAEDALGYLDTNPVQLVITDIRMPGMDGVEFARCVKQLQPDLPVIFITGAFNSSILKKVDVDGFLPKPFRIGQIEELIEEVISRSSSPNPGRGDTILVVDDDETFRLMLLETLKLSGYRTIGAASGDEALAVLRQSGVDAVITDIKMPGMDGITLAARIKERRPDMPVIIITGYIPADGERPLAVDGADGFLIKPFKIESITDLLETLKQRPSSLSP